MSINQAQTDILKVLYEGYRQNPNSMFDISPICEMHKISPKEMGDRLKSLTLIKPDIVYKEPKRVYCSITILGIYQINSDYVEQITTNLLEELSSSNNGSGNIVKLLNTSRFHFQFASDVAYYLQKLDYLTIELIDQDQNCILCDLSEQGKDESDRRQAEAQMRNFKISNTKTTSGEKLSFLAP